MARKVLIGTAALAASALLLGGAPSAVAAATAATDTAGPLLRLPASASFVVGTQIGASSGLFSDHPQTDGITQRVTWSATDPSGICGYDVFRVYNGQAPERVVAGSTQRSYTDTTTDYDDQQGGGTFKVSAWRVVAHDCAGNTTTGITRVLPVVTQENNRTYGYRGVQVAFSGSWATATCACWSGRHDRHSETAGDTATITRIWVAGDQVAVVSETGPERGTFAVYVDSVLRTSVDTYAATRQHRAVVWSSRMSAGTHTIELVNQATVGHPRVDLDAVLSNSALYCFC